MNMYETFSYLYNMVTRETIRGLLGSISEDAGRHEVPGELEELRQGQHTAAHHEEN